MKNKISTNLIVVSQLNNQKQSYLSDKKATNKCFTNNDRLEKIKFKKRKHFEEYCENSTVHGFRYFSNKNIHLLERVWWIIWVSCSMVACCMSIKESYLKWKENPVIVTFSEKMTPLKDIPFPAVTICPEVKSDRKLFNYSATLSKLNISAGPPLYNLTEREFKLASAQFQICEPFILNNSFGIGDDFAGENIFDLIREVSPKITHALLTCTFRTFRTDCGYLFQEVITDDGLCFTFNSLYSNEMFLNGINDNIMVDRNDTSVLNGWTLEDGYDRNIDHEQKLYLYPYRVFSSGSKPGLIIGLTMKHEDMDYFCRGPVRGFKVMLHSPNELPQVRSGQYFRVPLEHDLRVSIKPNMLKTMKSLKDYSPERRQCYFNSERKLQYLKIYNQKNCELECLANFTYQKCGCVRFSMPRDKNTPICGVAKVTCYNSAENDLLEDTASSEIRCNCLPACTSISYDSEITQATYEWSNFFKALNVSKNETNGFQFASISIFFKENQFITSKRSELVGLTDFISSCGGLLGLFMGVSLLSIVELIYYLSLRLFCSIRSSKIDEKSRIVSMQKKLRKSKQLIRPDPIWSSRPW